MVMRYLLAFSVPLPGAISANTRQAGSKADKDRYNNYTRT